MKIFVFIIEETEHAMFDDHSQAYLPHLEKKKVH